MTKSVFSDTAIIDRHTPDIEKKLSELSGGEIIRMAIIDVASDSYVISYSYKRQAKNSD